VVIKFSSIKLVAVKGGFITGLASHDLILHSNSSFSFFSTVTALQLSQSGGIAVQNIGATVGSHGNDCLVGQ